jgi:RNA polymerase sigma factor (sigma-70 family)
MEPVAGGAAMIDVSRIFAEQRARLRDFIRRRTPDPADAEDLVQEVFAELVEANRLLMPIDHVTGWLFRVARNRITDLFRKTKPVSLDERLELEDLLPSPEADPETLRLRVELIEELAAALRELSPDQRQVFVAHEIDGLSFQEISAVTGVNVNTLLSRKRNAVLHLRRRLQRIYEDFR